MRTSTSWLYVAATALALAGCDNGNKGAAPSGSATAAATGAQTKAGGAKAIAITKLGLKGSAEGETEDPIIGDGVGGGVMISGAKFTVTIAEAKPTDPKTAKDGEEAAKLFNPKNLKTETLPDGWALTYENTGSAGTNYFVNTRRELGGKAYLCDTMQSTPEQQKSSLAFCKSLTK